MIRSKLERCITLNLEGKHCESINNTDDHAETLQTGQIDCELHSLTHVTVEKAMVNLLQLIRQSQISKKQSERLLYFIKSILPVPNQMPKDMDTLLKALNMTDYFNKRTICILCDKDLEKNKNLCSNCTGTETKYVAHIRDTDKKLFTMDV
ncbi:unnamed protein product [Rotaria sp. Silwood2]|nr:unnamed protein product [Rotaria sp. Silwood2]